MQRAVYWAWGLGDFMGVSVVYRFQMSGSAVAGMSF